MTEGHRIDSPPQDLARTSAPPDDRDFVSDLERLDGQKSLVRRTVLFWRLFASGRVRFVLGGAVACALLFAVGTAALAGIIKWLVQPATPLDWVHTVMIAGFISRPISFTAHIRLVTRAVAMVLDDRQSDPSREPLPKAIVKQTVTATIILTRDLPAMVILSGYMVWAGGVVGSVIALMVLTGLVAAAPAQRLAYNRHKATASPRLEASHVDALGRRNSRAWSEASSDIVPMLLVLVLVVVKSTDIGFDLDDLTSVIVIAMLLARPMRRMARLIGQGRALADASDEDD